MVFVTATLALFVYPPSDLPRHVDGILGLLVALTKKLGKYVARVSR